MDKEEILSEYFLVETEKTEEIKGWKVIGLIEGCASQSTSTLLELSTDGESWLCDFKIKLLHCGLVLASPEYVIDEDNLLMEAMEKLWKEFGSTQQLQEILKQIPQGTWDSPATGTKEWWTNTITCSSSDSYSINGNGWVTTSTCSC